MLPKYEPVCYELLRPEQVRERRQAAPIAYVPMGSLEWHGLQNPLGTDGIKAHAVCCEAALEHGGIVLPVFYQGLLGDANWGPADWDGYTLGFNQADMHQAAMLGIVRGLVCGGWKVIAGITGHDVQPHVESFECALAEATAGTDVRGFAMMEGAQHKPDHDVPLSMDHAGAWETSCMLYAAPACVDRDALRRHGHCTTDTTEMSGQEGIGGKNPITHGSPEMGRRIVSRMGDLIGRRAAKLLGAERQPG